MVTYKPFDREVISDPYPHLAELRAVDPVHYSQVLNGWFVTDYEIVRNSLSDNQLSASRVNPYISRIDGDTQANLGIITGLMRDWFIFSDPPEHTILRKSCALLFGRQHLESIRKHIETFVSQCIKTAKHKRIIDAAEDIAKPIANFTICELLNIPEDDRQNVIECSAVLGPIIGRALHTKAEQRAASAKIEILVDYFTKLIKTRLKESEGKGVSELPPYYFVDQGLSIETLVATYILIIFGGQDTSANLISNTILSVINHPEIADQVRETPELSTKFIAEVLRFESPIKIVSRIAKETFLLADKKIKQGDILYLSLAAANRDPNIFTKPDNFFLRDNSNASLAFGGGIHKCIGLGLAQMTTQAVLSELSNCQLQLAHPAEKIAWIPSFVVRGIYALPVNIEEKMCLDQNR